MSSAHKLLRRLVGRDVAYLLAAAAVSCTTPQAATVPSAEEASSAPVFGEKAERNLENLYLFNCAPEYLAYPEGEGPPVPSRSDAEWEQRREDLTACGREVAGRYAHLEAIRALTWNGTTHSMSEAEMKAMAQRGPDYLEDYAEGLVQAERRRAGFSDTVAGEIKR
jgi:hypothetical protein